MTTNISSKKIPSNSFLILALTLICIGIFFRLYNLTWGAPYFFHPDERNIASSVSQLSYPGQMNPHFYAYGSLPIYCIYFIGILVNLLQNIFLSEKLDVLNVNFENAIIIGRSISFILSIFLIYVIYLFGKILKAKRAGLISAALASLSVGFIQYTHFATFEIWLSFFTLLLAYLLISYASSFNIKYALYSGGILGILLSIKISSLILVPMVVLILILVNSKKLLSTRKNKFVVLEKNLLLIFVTLIFSTVILYLTNPYIWIDSEGFLSSIRYESSVGFGTLPVFYTQGFIQSQPILYQLAKVYPFILNPFVMIFGILCIPFILKLAIHTKRKDLFILGVFLSVTFFSQAFLYVKWIRYYIPTLAFIYIFIGFSIDRLLANYPKGTVHRITYLIIFILLLSSLTFSFAYFKTTLYETDSRIQALEWAKKNIAEKSEILSEVYDLGIIPFNPHYPSITLFNFYDLEADISMYSELENVVSQSEFIILPSQRVLESRFNNPQQFPVGNAFYKKILTTDKNFHIVYKTPCDIFCKILYLGSPAFSFEQTANVFDRPEVYIIKHEQEKFSQIQE